MLLLGHLHDRDQDRKRQLAPDFEVIMPPSTGAETLQVRDLAVMVRGSFFVAVVVVPVIAVAGATGDWLIILAASAVAATRGTRAAYRRIRRD